MRDYNFYFEDGRSVPIAQMSDEDIAACLRNGVQIVDDDGRPDPATAVRERLILEQQIRAMGLR